MPRYSKHALIVALLWLFAPAAWYLMWKDKSYHSWFAPLLFVNGIVIGGVVITQAFIIVPWISKLYEAYGVHPLPFFSTIMGILIISFCVIQIIYGYYVRKRKDLKQNLVREHLALILTFFTIDVIIGLLTGLIKILPPYTWLPIG